MNKYLCVVLARLISYLPLRIIRGIGSILGLSLMYFSKRSGRRLKNNLLLTGFANANTVNQVAKNVAQELGKTLIETISMVWYGSPMSKQQSLMETVNFDLFQELALRGDTPIVLLSPHISTFEMCMKYTAYKLPHQSIKVLYKPSASKWFNDLMLQGRRHQNVELLPTNLKGVFHLMKHLQQNGIIGLLPDSVASQGNGTWVNFFGQKTFATTLVAKMLQVKDVVTFFLITIRTKSGFKIQCIPFKPTQVDNVADLVQEIYVKMEQIIKQDPQQYYWSYDRFRIPKNAHLMN